MSTNGSNRVARRLPLKGWVAGTLVWILGMAVPAGAAPATLREKQAQAAKLQDQLERQGDQVSVLAEKYNRARLKVNELESSIVQVEAEVTRSDTRMAEARARVTDAAVNAYVHGGGSAMLSTLARSGNGGEIVVRREYLRVAVSDQREVVDELRSVKAELGENRARLADERDEARKAAGDAQKLQAEAARAEESLNRLLGQVQGEVATLVAAEQARREAADAARRRALAAARAPMPAASKAIPLGNVAPSQRGAVAVEEARKHLGKPYVYGGSGPNNFDCSGLTSYAWRAAGVRLSHSAHAQWFETTRVPIDQVAPGDLLFFGPSVSGIHHNAIYIGGGQMIEASRTGTPVRIRGWRSADLVGAGRPG